MTDTQPINADPMVETVSPNAPRMDYPSHIKTYNRFLRLVKWFCIHMVFLMVALYCYIIAGQPILGSAWLLIGIALLLFGLTRNPNVRRDFEASVTNTAPAE